MTKRTDYQTLMEDQLKKWSSGHSSFKAATDQWEAQAKAQYEKNLELVDATRKEAWANLSRMKSASDDTWEKIRIQMDKSWEDFKKSVDQLTAVSKK